MPEAAHVLGTTLLGPFDLPPGAADADRSETWGPPPPLARRIPAGYTGAQIQNESRVPPARRSWPTSLRSRSTPRRTTIQP